MLMMRASHYPAATVLALLLGACGGDAPLPSGQAVRSDPANVAAALDALALEEGVLASAGDPAGGYGRSYVGGRDRLCITATGASGEERYRFAIEVRVGETEGCAGRGEARLSGGTMPLAFDGTKCRITARYDGDRIVMPGVVDDGCAALCTRRGSLAGVTFPRLGEAGQDAMMVTDSDGGRLCG